MEGELKMQKVQTVPARRAPVQGPRGGPNSRVPLFENGMAFETRRTCEARSKPNPKLSPFEAEMLLVWSLN